MHSVLRYWKSLTKPAFKWLGIFQNMLSILEWVVREKLLIKCPLRWEIDFKTCKILKFHMWIGWVNQMICTCTYKISHFSLKEKKWGKIISGIGTH